MVPKAEKLGLTANEFALYFKTEDGIEAGELGSFLKRAATVAGNAGAEIRVIGLQTGSLAVIFTATKKSRVGRAIKKEFLQGPVDTTLKVTGLIAAVVGAITWAMTPTEGQVSPLAKAGAEVVEQHQVTKIEIITIDNSIVIMDEARARKVRELESSRHRELRAPRHDVRIMADEAQRGVLSGVIIMVGRELHFRPDGYRYLVPVDASEAQTSKHLFPDVHYQIAGRLLTRDGLPDLLVVASAKRI